MVFMPHKTVSNLSMSDDLVSCNNGRHRVIPSRRCKPIAILECNEKFFRVPYSYLLRQRQTLEQFLIAFSYQKQDLDNRKSFRFGKGMAFKLLKDV